MVFDQAFFRGQGIVSACIMHVIGATATNRVIILAFPHCSSHFVALGKSGNKTFAYGRIFNGLYFILIKYRRII